MKQTVKISTYSMPDTNKNEVGGKYDAIEIKPNYLVLVSSPKLLLAEAIFGISFLKRNGCLSCHSWKTKSKSRYGSCNKDLGGGILQKKHEYHRFLVFCSITLVLSTFLNEQATLTSILPTLSQPYAIA